MSGLVSASQSSSLGSRAFTEFTFQVARRTLIAFHRKRGPCQFFTARPSVLPPAPRGWERRLRLGVVTEAVDETAEHAALVRQGCLGGRSLGAFMALWGVVVGPRDGVHDLGLVEGIRARDLRYEADQVAVEQDLGLQAGGALSAPDSLASAGNGYL